MTSSLVLLKARGQLEVFDISRTVPWSKKPVFSKVSAQTLLILGYRWAWNQSNAPIVGQIELGPQA
jgi:hypothetical protein